MRLTKIIFICLLIVPLLASAQAPFQLGIQLGAGLPQNEFKESVEATGWGLSGSFGYRLPNSPIVLGATAGFYIYGRETWEEPWSNTINYFYVDVTTTNTIITGDLFLRVQPGNGPVVPYVDALLGFNYLTTNTSIDDDDFDDDTDPIATDNNYNDIAFSYGAGAGFLIQVYKHVPDREYQTTDLDAVYIDLGFRYMKGGEAEYLKRGHIQDTLDNVQKSRTDLFSILVGVTFTFK